ncbi:MAG: hypothetical protein AAFN40_04430 [Cyanobacteria bacterium J06560_6]
MNAIINHAYELPAAILIRNDLRYFSDPNNVTYEIGIQQPRQHKRFANFFRYGNNLVMYFKHDVARIEQLYAQFPDTILPSEIATKYWSKITVNDEPTVAERLLVDSHHLVCAAITKKGRAMVEDCGTTVNRFATFHKAAVQLSQHENICLTYQDYQEPMLSVGRQPIIKYSWNRIYLRQQNTAATNTDWATLGPEAYRNWPHAMKLAIKNAKT